MILLKAAAKPKLFRLGQLRDNKITNLDSKQNILKQKKHKLAKKMKKFYAPIVKKSKQLNNKFLSKGEILGGSMPAEK